MQGNQRSLHSLHSSNSSYSFYISASGESLTLRSAFATIHSFMPLRHSTETALILLLGLVIVCTGFLIATLPPVPEGIVAWAILMALAIAYPILLMPLFQARRADTPLRTMHWFPAFMLLLWFGIEVVALSLPRFAVVQGAYTTVWTLPAVALGILILLLYCLNVIRRRVPRIATLLLMFACYAVLGVSSMRGGGFETQVASLLWDQEWWQILGTRSTLTGSGQKKSLEDIAASADSSEERWRRKLRASERRNEREAKRRSNAESSDQASSAARSTMAKSSSSALLWRSASSAPAALPSSGGAVEVLALTLVALYSGVLHDRARRRGC